MFLYSIVVGTFYLLGFIFVLYFGWCFYLRTSTYYSTVNKIPGPSFYLPVLGNALDLAGGLDHVLQMFQEKWPQTHGEIFRIFIGSHCYVALSSPELLETILNSQKIIDKGSSYKYLHPWLGQGLLTSTGDYWRAHRKMLTPAFHFKILDSFVDVFNEQSRTLVEIIGEICDSFPEKKGEIDVYPMLTRCSLDIICEAAMGTKIRAQKEDSEYVKAVYRIAQVIMMQSQSPWMWNHTIFAHSALGREHAKLLETLHSFTDGVINNRREIMRKDNHIQDGINDDHEIGIKKPLALLDLLLTTSDNGNPLTHQEIRQEIDTFMFEGHDTTTSLLSWFLFSMASNPKCQENVWIELQSVFEDSDRDCTREDIPNLKYLECCIKETLRLYPSVPGFERETFEDIRIGEYLVPAGCTIGCMTMATHRNPRVFPDPLVFNPERFRSNETIGRHPYAYFPFSAGPRNCIGQRFAMLESKVILSSLLRRFKFQLSENSKAPIPSAQLILKSLTGINLIVSRRSSE